MELDNRCIFSLFCGPHSVGMRTSGMPFRMAFTLVSWLMIISTTGVSSIGEDDDGVCRLPCKAALEVESQWVDVWTLTDLPEHIQTGLTALGWTQEAWDGCYTCAWLHPICHSLYAAYLLRFVDPLVAVRKRKCG